jgi:glycosyltransferase involved in cell wall biosynthesis
MPYKRVSLLIEFMMPILEEYPDAVLHVAGAGSTQEELQRMVEERDLGEHVILHGYVSEQDKVRLLQQAWVFMTPSMKEGWGLVVIEANACGTPVVAFNVPGLRDAVYNEHAGILANSRKEFLAGVLSLLGDEARRDRMSRSAAAYAQGFNWRTTASQTLRIIESVMAETVQSENPC